MKFLFTLLLFSVSSLCLSQRHVFLNYGINDGLAHSQVRSLFQDKNAVLWIGTLGGVSAFDGQEFRGYSTDDGLMSNEVTSITQLKTGEIVFGGRGGVSVFNGRSFIRHKFKKEWEYTGVNKLLLAGDSLLIASEKGLASLVDGKLNYFPSLFSEDDKNLKSIDITGDTLLLLTKNTLFSWSALGFKTKTTVEELTEVFQTGSTTFMDLICDSEGRIYLATSGIGLVEIMGENVDRLTAKEGLTADVINKLYLDDQEGIISCSRYGFSHLKNGKLLSFTENNGLDFEDVRAVIQDSEGRYWIGSNGRGIYKLSGYAFTYFTSDEGLSSNAIMTIGQHDDGEMYFGSFDSGMSMTKKEEWAYLAARELTNDKIWCNSLGPNGYLWIGTGGGIDVVKDYEVIRRFTEKDNLSSKKITSLFFDKEKNGFWAGSSKGLNFIQGQIVEQFPDFEGTKIRDIETDGEKLYLASRQGVWVFKDDLFELLPSDNTLVDKTVYCLKWLRGELWTGTKNGLYRYQNGISEKISLANNQTSNTINFLNTDPAGNIWAGTNQGLLKVTPELECESYTEQDGLVSLETNLNSSFSDGENLWFGTNLALQRLNYQELNASKTLPSPEVVMKDVRLNLTETEWQDKTKHFLSATNVPVHPEVTYKNNNFSFRFHAKSVEEKSNLRYQYKLEGYDEKWQPVTEEAIATYTNLPYSDFQFLVRAKRIGQKWGAELNYPFSISPPFWRTWWFILLSLLSISYISYRVFRYRRQNLITALEKEKFELKSKMLALEQQSLNSSMNRHFIFNALNSIQYYINRQDRLSANRYLSSFAKLIRKNLDSSQVNFTSLADELERLELYLEIENMRFKDKFDYQIAVSPDIDEEVVKIPSMLLQPYLENSIWHGILPQEKKGVIKVQIERNKLGQMEIRITDNGIGITTSQALKNGKAAHISKGMNITSGRLELLKEITSEKITLIGPFEVKDENEQVQGTQVTIKLPLEYKEVV